MTKPPFSDIPASDEIVSDEISSDENLSPAIIPSHLVVDSNANSAAEAVESEVVKADDQVLVPASRSPFDRILARQSRKHPEILLAGAFVAVLCAGAGFQYWLHRNDAPPVIAPTAQVTPAPAAQLVSAADTLLIRPRTGATYSTLRGKIRAAGVITGQAPMSGQVSRVMFKVGQNVQVGDRILTLTGGPIAAAPRGIERLQDKAEAAQIAAVKGQQSVANQISGAQASYNEAKVRVEAAEKRLSEARTMLSRLRNGEQIPLPTNANTQKSEKPTARKPTRRKSASNVAVSNNPQRARAQSERDAAIAAAVKAQKNADAATTAAKAAFGIAASTDNVVRTKRARVESARAALREVENQFAAGKNKASDVDTARGELASAQAEADEALDKTKVAREASNRMEREAESARKVSQQAADRAAAALQKLQMFAATPKATANAQDTPAPVATGETTPDSGPRLMTARDAVNMVRDAVEESEAAARNARKWKLQIDSYGDKVKKSSQRIEASSEQLMKAQQRVMDVTIERNLSVVRAPASGIIQSIADVADNVETGEPLVKIGSGRGMEVVFSDNSGLWRRLKPGMTLTAMARMPQKTAPAANTAKTPAPTATPTEEIPVVLKVRDIDAPEAKVETKATKNDDKKAASKAEPAFILAAVEPAPSAKARLRNGMGVICSLPAADAQSAVRIPAPAIWRDGNQAMVAVLEPVAPVTPVAQISNAVAADDVEINAAMFRVQWRPVALVPQRAGQDSAQRAVLSGLQPGDRILRRAADWRQWSQVNGENATVRVALS